MRLGPISEREEEHQMREWYAIPLPRSTRVRGQEVSGVRQPELRRDQGEGRDGYAHQGGQQHGPERGRGHVRCYYLINRRT